MSSLRRRPPETDSALIGSLGRSGSSRTVRRRRRGRGGVGRSRRTYLVQAAATTENLAVYVGDEGRDNVPDTVGTLPPRTGCWRAGSGTRFLHRRNRSHCSSLRSLRHTSACKQSA
jgi:hypothetical protein